MTFSAQGISAAWQRFIIMLVCHIFYLDYFAIDCDNVLQAGLKSALQIMFYKFVDK